MGRPADQRHAGAAAHGARHRPAGRAADDAAQRGTRGGRPGAALSRRPGFGRGAMPSHAGPPTVSGRWSALPTPVRIRPGACTCRRSPCLSGTASSSAAPRLRSGCLAASARSTRCSGLWRTRASAGAATSSRDSGPRSSPCQVRWTGCARWRTRPRASAVAGGPRGRHRASQPARRVVVLSAADPANAYGAALPWPERPDGQRGRGHRPGRKAGALVVLVRR